MPKKARTEAWRKKRRQEHLEMKNTDITFSVKVRKRNRIISKDSKNGLKKIRFTKTWF